MPKDTLILASGSPRRIHLLKECRIRFKAVDHSFNEDSLKIQNPIKLAEQLSYFKAKSVADRKEYYDKYVLGVDTIVAINNKILGKPRNKKQAEERWCNQSVFCRFKSCNRSQVIYYVRRSFWRAKTSCLSNRL